MAGGYDGEIRIKTKIDNGDVPSQLMQLEARMQKATKEATRLSDEMRRMEQTKIPTEEYKDISDGLHRSTLELDKLLKRQEDMATKGKTSGAVWDDLDRKIKEVSADIEAAREYQRQMAKEGTAYVDTKSTAEYQKLSDKLRDTNAQIDILKRKEEELAAKQGKVGNGAKQIEKVGKAAKKTQGGIEKLTNSFKRTIASFLMFSIIMRTFSVAADAFKEGVQKMAQYSTSFNGKMSELKSATATLRASLGTLAAPIISSVVPALVTLINWITNAINKINELVAALSGRNTWTRAKKQQVDYAKSLDSTANAAKKAKGALQGFDELNVIQSQDTGGGGGSGETNGADMYEEVPTSQKLIDKLKPFLDFLKDFKEQVIKGWDETWDRLNIDEQIEHIKKSISSIKKSLADIFGSADVQNAAYNFAMSLAYSIGQIGASLTSIGLTLAENLLGGIAIYLESNVDRIKQYLVKMFDIGSDIVTLAGNAMEAFAYVFQAFGNEDGQQITANLIQMFNDVFMSVSTIVLELVDDLLHLFLDPFINNKEEFRVTLEGFLDVVADVTSTIADTVRQTTDGIVALYEEHIHPFIQSLTDGMTEIVNKFLEFWSTYMKPALDEAAGKFDTLMKEHIQPLIDGVLECVGSIVDYLKMLWEQILQPLIAWVIANVLPVLLPIIQGLWDGIMEFVGFVADAIAGIIQVIKGIIDFMTGVFSGDWEKAWNGVSDIVTGVMDTIGGVIKAAMTIIKTIVQTQLNFIKAIFTTIFSAVSSLVKFWMNTIKTAISTIMGHIKSGISTVLGNVKDTWTTQWTSMKDTVINIFKGIWNGIKGIINSIIGGVEKMANSVISGLNAMIESLDKLQWDIPEWVPAIGGNKFGLNIPTISSVSIPRLANGGITTGSTLANIGEAGREAVLPLENNLSYLEPLAEMIAGKMEGVQTVRIVPEESGIFKVVRDEANSYYRRTGKPAFLL